ncbi:MAG: hypothetical protein PHS93_09175 [Candidatus Omnitrophica bacterium]|nr:hypothetical protein [Candidatus Omnitrophota bacterium]
MKIIDTEYQIKRDRSWRKPGEEWYYTIWQRNKFIWWGGWWCWTQSVPSAFLVGDVIDMSFNTLQKAEKAIPRGGRIVRKPLK